MGRPRRPKTSGEKAIVLALTVHHSDKTPSNPAQTSCPRTKAEEDEGLTADTFRPWQQGYGHDAKIGGQKHRIL